MDNSRNSSSQTVSDSDRKQIEEELAAALLLIYSGKRQQALAQLGAELSASTLPLAAQRKVLDFAEERAQLIQSGVNERMDGADDPAAVQASIAHYNATVLQPFLASWAAHQALIDAYSETPASAATALQISAETHGSARDAVQWEWVQNTDYPDDCMQAAAASPASYDDLIAISGGPPPVHPRCQCTFGPV